MKASNYIRIRQKKIEAALDVFVYKKDGVFYAYSPALDLVGYDYTEDGAKESFGVVMQDFFEFGIKRNTLEADLTSHGWKEEKKSEFEITNIWAVLANSPEGNKLALTQYEKTSVPFEHELAYC